MSQYCIGEGLCPTLCLRYMHRAGLIDAGLDSTRETEPAFLGAKFPVQLRARDAIAFSFDRTHSGLGKKAASI